MLNIAFHISLAYPPHSCHTSGMAPNPFAHNPLNRSGKLTLVVVPPIPETHERRPTLRQYLGRPDNPLKLPSGDTPSKKPKIVYVEKRVESEPEDE